MTTRRTALLVDVVAWITNNPGTSKSELEQNVEGGCERIRQATNQALNEGLAQIDRTSHKHYLYPTDEGRKLAHAQTFARLEKIGTNQPAAELHPHVGDAKLLAQIKNGAWLDQQTFTDSTAGELIDNGECTPQCLTANDDTADTCYCPCDGQYHGSLRDTPTTPNPDWTRPELECVLCHKSALRFETAHLFDLTKPVCRACARNSRSVHTALLREECPETWHDMWDHSSRWLTAGSTQIREYMEAQQ